MAIRKIITGALLLFVVASLAVVIWRESQTTAAGVGTTHSGVVVYYFHWTQRCPTCLKIEKMAHEVVTSEFASALRSGNLSWMSINVDEPSNAHFVGEFQLAFQSLVVVKNNESGTVRWANLEKVWEYVGNEAVFRDYVRNEVDSFLSQ